MTDLRQRWTKALRSGDYDQTKYQLRQGDTFCCLGVLCDLYDPNGWDGNDYQDAEHEDNDPAAAAIRPPVYVWQEAGLNRGDLTNLSARNDGLGYDPHSFDEVADVLESWFGEGDT